MRFFCCFCLFFILCFYTSLLSAEHRLFKIPSQAENLKSSPSSQIATDTKESQLAIWKIGAIWENPYEREESEDIKISGFSGTGFFISPTHVITNFHVISYLLDKQKLENIYLSQKQSPLIFKIKELQAISGTHDLALLKVQAFDLSLWENPDSLTAREKQFFGKETEPVRTRDSSPYYLEIADDSTIEPSGRNLLIQGYHWGTFRSLQKNGPFFQGIHNFLDFFHLRNLSGVSGSPLLNHKAQVLGVATIAGTVRIPDMVKSSVIFTRTQHLLNFIEGSEGVSCKTGEEKHQCFQGALDITLLQARAGNPASQLQLSHMYRNGKGVPQDREKSHYWMSSYCSLFMQDANSQMPLESLESLFLLHYISCPSYMNNPPLIEVAEKAESLGFKKEF